MTSMYLQMRAPLFRRIQRLFTSSITCLTPLAAVCVCYAAPVPLRAARPKSAAETGVI